MADDRDSDCDTTEHRFRTWEDQCVDDYETQTKNMDDWFQNETEMSQQKLWTSFQTSATSVAQLYKDRHQGLSLWIPFQNAASSVTVLYKDSVEVYQRGLDVGQQRGVHKKTRDILSWAKKRKRHIRREDLIAYLSGKNPPPRHRLGLSPPSPRPRIRMSPPRANLRTASLGAPLEPISETLVEPDLHTFREALALQGLNGAMSNVSVGFGSTPNTSATARSNMDELTCFISDEIFRNSDSRKRTATTDVRPLIDSPTKKRTRLL